MDDKEQRVEIPQPGRQEAPLPNVYPVRSGAGAPPAAGR